MSGLSEEDVNRLFYKNGDLGQLMLSDMVTMGHNQLRTLSVYQGKIVPAIKVQKTRMLT